MNGDRTAQIYALISGFEIELDPDPVSRGPRYLQALIAECRNYLNQVSRLVLEINQEKQLISSQLRASQVAHQLSFDHMLAHDERVRRLPSIGDRESATRVLLRDEISGIEALKAQLEDLDFVDKAVKHRHKELISTMSEIRAQKGLIQAEISTGAMYGDERGKPDGFGERSGTNNPAGMSTVDEEEIEALFHKVVETSDEEGGATPEGTTETPVEAVTEESAVPVEEAPEEQSLESSDPSEAEVQDFLTAGDPSAAVVDEFDDLFENMLGSWGSTALQHLRRLGTTAILQLRHVAPISSSPTVPYGISSTRGLVPILSAREPPRNTRS